MANIASAIKRARQSEKLRLHNASQRSFLRTQMKKVVTAIEDNDREAAENAYKAAIPVIDAMVGKGIIHKNKAARHKSRLNSRLKTLKKPA